MEPLSPEFRFNIKSLETKFQRITSRVEKRSLDVEMIREKITSSGISVQRIDPKMEKNEVEFLASDSSLAKRELRYFALWGLHTVTLRAAFDKKRHKDPLAHGSINYRNLMYNSYLDLDIFTPWQGVEDRANLIRVRKEYKSLIESSRELKSEGLEIDYLLLDGSIYTTMKRLNEERYTAYKEHPGTLEAAQELLEEGKVVGMVEDSHATDISVKMGLDMTNLSLFDIILDEGEFIVDRKKNINVCYIKLPAKALNYTPSRKSKPVTVRWEFSYPDFECDLNTLTHIWMLEDDLVHPQIYPLRICDYLTRRLKVGGILDKVVAESDLDLRYRDSREA